MCHCIHELDELYILYNDLYKMGYLVIFNLSQGQGPNPHKLIFCEKLKVGKLPFHKIFSHKNAYTLLVTKILHKSITNSIAIFRFIWTIVKAYSTIH
jgi:hypothetical protein